MGNPAWSVLDAYMCVLNNWPRSLAKHRDDGLGSVHTPVHLSVGPLTVEPLILGSRLCLVQQRVKESHYQSKIMNNRMDAVDRLLIIYSFLFYSFTCGSHLVD